MQAVAARHMPEQGKPETWFRRAHRRHQSCYLLPREEPAARHDRLHLSHRDWDSALCWLRGEGAEPHSPAAPRRVSPSLAAGFAPTPGTVVPAPRRALHRLLATVSSFFGEGSRNGSGDGGGWCQRHKYISVVER